MENPKGYRIEELLFDGAPVQPSRIYRAAMLGEQGVPKKYGSQRQKIEIDAIEYLQQLFARGCQVRGIRRGSVVAVRCAGRIRAPGDPKWSKVINHSTMVGSFQ